MDQDRADLNRPEDEATRQDQANVGTGQPSQTDRGLPPQGPSGGVEDEGEDQGFGERPAGSEEGTPGTDFSPRPTEDGVEEGDQGAGRGGD
jgi:hypothetical protein